MSKVRSYDGYVVPRTGAMSRERIRDATMVPGRFVSWPEDAPDPKDVPHAGERVRNYVVGEGMVDAVVETGIPLRSFMGDRDTWVMTVVTERGRHVVDLSVIRRIPPEPTDGEVVGTLTIRKRGAEIHDRIPALRGLPDGEYEIRRVGKEEA